MELKALVDYTRQLLQVERYADYCPNGLQLEGGVSVKKIVSGVTILRMFQYKFPCVMWCHIIINLEWIFI